MTPQQLKKISKALCQAYDDIALSIWIGKEEKERLDRLDACIVIVNEAYRKLCQKK